MTNPYRSSLGIVSEEATQGRSRIVLDVLERHQNGLGVAHGGLVASLLDVAMGTALRSLLGGENHAVTIDMHMQFLAPGTGRLIAEGRVLRQGRAVHFVEAEIVSAESGALVATGRGTFSARSRDREH